MKVKDCCCSFYILKILFCCYLILFFFLAERDESCECLPVQQLYFFLSKPGQMLFICLSTSFDKKSHLFHNICLYSTNLIICHIKHVEECSFKKDAPLWFILYCYTQHVLIFGLTSHKNQIEIWRILSNIKHAEECSFKKDAPLWFILYCYTQHVLIFHN